MKGEVRKHRPLCAKYVLQDTCNINFLNMCLRITNHLDHLYHAFCSPELIAFFNYPPPLAGLPSSSSGLLCHFWANNFDRQSLCSFAATFARWKIFKLYRHRLVFISLIEYALPLGIGLCQIIVKVRTSPTCLKSAMTGHKRIEKVHSISYCFSSNRVAHILRCFGKANMDIRAHIWHIDRSNGIVRRDLTMAEKAIEP